MPKLPAVRPLEVIRVLESIGFYKVRQKFIIDFYDILC